MPTCGPSITGSKTAFSKIPAVAAASQALRSWGDPCELARPLVRMSENRVPQIADHRIVKGRPVRASRVTCELCALRSS